MVNFPFYSLPTMTAPADLLDLSFKEIQDLEREIGLKEFQKRYGEVISNTAAKVTKRPPVDATETSDDDKEKDLKEERFNATRKTKKKKKTTEKWEPVELSSKVKPRSLHSGPTKPNPQKTAKIRDPRFDDVCGTFDKDLFEKGYGFINEMKAEEERSLKKFIKSAKEGEELEEAKEKLKAMKRASGEQTKEKKVDEKLKSLKKAELAAVKEGKKPFFLKKSERKKLTLAEKFKELKQSGKLEKYMEKKRKRNAAKLKKALPSSTD